jgi:endothelin-converting enzyme/putative endopeptidase
MNKTAFLFLSLLLPAVQAPAQAVSDRHGINISSIDPSVQPGDNFYLFANGSWIKNTELPPDRVGIGVFSVLTDRSDERTAAIVEETSKSNPAPETDNRRIADLYASYMDETAIEAHGMTSLKPRLAATAAIKTRTELSRALGETVRADVDALNNTNFHTPNIFGLWVAPGFNDPSHYAAYLLQGGLELPDREYYLSQGARMVDIRDKYRNHVEAMLRLAGFSNPGVRAVAIVALEFAIAQKHISLADDEDIHKANNVWHPADFTSKAPGIDWPEFFRGAGLSHQTSFIVWQPSAFKGESALVASEPLDSWKDYLAYHLIESYANGISKAIAEEHFNLTGKILSGVPQQRPRDHRAVVIVNGWLGDAVGQIYAQKYFSPEAKAQVQELVANLITAFHKRLDSITWMAPSTKTEALTKLDALRVSVGYPDHWRSYNGLEIKPDDLFGNLWRCSLFEYRYELSRIDKLVDRGEWTMEPQTVNAVNLPLHNALNFPAAILEPPFFDPKGPAASNYGGIGTIIGHEISHTFDSEGAAFNSKGRVRNWWTPGDYAHFQAASAALVAQYDAYKPFTDLSLNGRQTLGENIADLGGVAAAFDAYHAALKGSPASAIDGYTGDQQFFIAYAQNWQSKFRENALRQQILTDPHSPGEYRTATVRNNDGWYASFDIKPTDKLYLAPKDRIRIW